MFFVGATGHILTLLLTVLLPFILVIGGNKNSHQVKKHTPIEVKTYILKSTTTLHSNSFQVSVEEKKEEIQFSAYKGTLKKIPIPQFQVLWKCSLLLCSGNKAPPIHKLN